jgi:hypothetical protein
MISSFQGKISEVLSLFGYRVMLRKLPKLYNNLVHHLQGRRKEIKVNPGNHQNKGPV